MAGDKYLMYLNPETNFLVHNGILILPHYVSFYWQVSFKMTTYVYRRSQTWLETKFHVANSRNKDLVHNGILALPHYVCFIGKLGLK